MGPLPAGGAIAERWVEGMGGGKKGNTTPAPYQHSGQASDWTSLGEVSGPGPGGAGSPKCRGTGSSFPDLPVGRLREEEEELRGVLEPLQEQPREARVYPFGGRWRGPRRVSILRKTMCLVHCCAIECYITLLVISAPHLVMIKVSHTKLLLLDEYQGAIYSGAVAGPKKKPTSSDSLRASGQA